MLHAVQVKNYTVVKRILYGYKAQTIHKSCRTSSKSITCVACCNCFGSVPNIRHCVSVYSKNTVFPGNGNSSELKPSWQVLAAQKLSYSRTPSLTRALQIMCLTLHFTASNFVGDIACTGVSLSRFETRLLVCLGRQEEIGNWLAWQKMPAFIQWSKSVSKLIVW